MKLKPTIKSAATLGQTLAASRKRLGFTLREVEAATGLSNAQVSLIESDKIESPSARSLFKLCKLYTLELKQIAAFFEK